jgi:hypothetical protein
MFHGKLIEVINRIVSYISTVKSMCAENLPIRIELVHAYVRYYQSLYVTVLLVCSKKNDNLDRTLTQVDFIHAYWYIVSIIHSDWILQRVQFQINHRSDSTCTRSIDEIIDRVLLQVQRYVVTKWHEKYDSSTIDENRVTINGISMEYMSICLYLFTLRSVRIQCRKKSCNNT